LATINEKIGEAGGRAFADSALKAEAAWLVPGWLIGKIPT